MDAVTTTVAVSGLSSLFSSLLTEQTAQTMAVVADVAANM